MQNFLFSPLAPILALILGIAFWIVQDQVNRKQRTLLLHEIESRKVKAVYFDTKATRRRSSFTGFSIIWENVEIVFTEKSILYFSYFQLFDYRLYMFIKHWHVPGIEVPREIHQSFPIEDIEIKDQNLVITALLKFSEETIIIKNAVESKQIETIKKMLSYEDYQED